MKTRKLKIQPAGDLYRQATGQQAEKSSLTLSGNWLRELGF